MKRRALIAASVLATAISCCGCVTTRSTKGFQTNPPARAADGLSQNMSNQNDPQGMRKFFAGLSNNQKNQLPKTESNIAKNRDATSLQSPGTVSAELLIVAGEMGLNQRRFDLARDYFERALKIEPNNVRAKLGLSKANGRVSGQAPIDNRREAQQQNQRMPNSFGLNDSPTDHQDNGIQLVSFVEDVPEDTELTDTVRPKSISVESYGEGLKPHMTMSPAIRAQRTLSSQRVANPYFATVEATPETKSSRAKRKPVFKIRPVKVRFDVKARSITDDEI